MTRLRHLPYVAVVTLALAASPALVTAKDSAKALYLGTTPEADRESVALALVVSPPRDVVRYDCQLDSIIGLHEDSHSRKFGEYSLIAMRPGMYRMTAVYKSTGREGFMFDEYRFEAGHIYRIACGGNTVRKAHISVSDITDKAPASRPEGPVDGAAATSNISP